MSLVIDEHRQYLEDDARLSAFRTAIAATVKPGSVVVDLGTGTGILGLFACRAGARRVYAIEESGMIEVARAIYRANGFGDRVVFLKGLSTRVDLPEKADIVCCDQIGRFGFEAGLLRYYRDASRRFLKPGGVLIPSRVDLWVAPIEDPALRQRIEFWTTRPAGFDLGVVRPLAVNTGYAATLGADALLGDPVRVGSIVPAAAPAGPIRLDGTAVATRAGELHGIGGWFAAELSPGVVMTNAPVAPDAIGRRHVFFPIDRAVAMAPGDRIRVAMRVLPDELVVGWTVEVDGKGRFTHSTLQGMLIATEDLDRTRPDFAPALSPWGEARLTILSLCDGRRPLAEIEREVYRQHGPLFESPAEAAEFVAEVVTRYAR